MKIYSGEKSGKPDWPLQGIDLDGIGERIDRSAAIFNGFVARAERALLGGDPDAVAAWAQLAAGFAWNSHPGAYCSPPLENMLLQIAADIRPVALPTEFRLPAVDVSRRKVLHVLTTALPTGGHTRVVERWIRNSPPDESHSVIIDSSGSHIPQWLRDAVAASGGGLVVLDSPLQSLLRKAAILRQLAHDWADLVVLHISPYDPVPIIAFGVASGPPVIFFNHADHVFWLGASVADIIADLRPSGQELTRQRRGRTASVILPIPLVLPRPAVDRATARKQLGIDEQTTVLLTIASAYKYSPLGGFDFLDLHSRILDRFPHVTLLAVGPSDSGQWANYKAAGNGRIRAFGVQHDLSLYHAAADIYLDSFPFASLTSMFEVGLYEKPLIGLANPVSMINCGDDISLNRCATHFPSREEYEAMLCRLIGDVGLRQKCGVNVARAIREDHVTPGWNAFLGRLMAAVPEKHAVKRLPELQCQADMNDVFLTCTQQSGGSQENVYSLLARHIRYLPSTARYALALENLQRRGVFAERRLRMKEFRSYRMLSSKTMLAALSTWWRRRRAESDKP